MKPKPSQSAARPRAVQRTPTDKIASAAKPEIYFKDRAALRTWLSKHHATHGPIWLVYDKRNTNGVRHLSYDDIVEEALCFGWIDSVSGSVSATRAKLYFSPRKPRSGWSALNKRRIERLLAEGLMTPAGQTKIDAAKADGSWSALDAAEALEVPPDLKTALRANAAAQRHFNAFPPGVRKQILTWIGSAKRDATRRERVNTTVSLAARNIRANQPKAAQRRPSKSKP